MYSIGAYGRLIADTVRTDAYAEALRRAVRPSSVVLDLGTGTGILAVLACQLGARRVYAIEPDAAIQVARAVAVANGCAERIEFIQDYSTRLTLPERADVIVADLRGALPPFQHHFPSIADARQRLLAPGGTLVPQRDTIWAAPVEAMDQYRRQTAGYEGNPYGVDLGEGLRYVTNTLCKARFTPDQLLARSQCWATVDYTTVESPHLAGSLTWTVTRPGIGHGLAVWFDSLLIEGVSFSNAPGLPELIYGCGFFPWSRPVPLAEGDEVVVTVKANLVGDDYVWSWDTRVLSSEQPTRVKADYRQSTFFASPLSAARLQKRAADHVPQLNEDGSLDLFILGLMDGHASVGDIARRVQQCFPARFGRWEDALTRVGALAERYGR